jgi:L,D-transpeptidase YcbB
MASKVRGSSVKDNRTASPVLLHAALIAILVLLDLASSSAVAEPNPKFVLQDVQKLLKNKSGLPLDVRTQATQLEQYYGRKDAKILWLESERNQELVSALSGLTTIGVTTMDAALARVEMRKQALKSEDTSILALVELTFSATLIEAAQKLRLGQMHLYRESLHPRTLQRFIYGDRLLALVASGQPLTPLLASLEPQIADYQAIRQKLIQYVAVQRNGGWPAITSGPDLKLGDAGPRVADLRQRLQTTGYLPPSSTSSDTFDEALTAALQTFQRQHAIQATGKLDRRTILTLNVPVADRVAQLITNLERWRWFEDVAAGTVWIINTNIARLELRASDRLRQAYVLKVDGTCEQLPAFDTTIYNVDLGPSYMFPQAIAARYILPVLQSKPESLDPSLTIYAGSTFQGVASVDWKSYSEANFPFSVTQSPGKTNVIGEFRFPLKDDARVSIHGRPTLDPQLPMPRSLWSACVALSGGADAVASLMGEAGIGQPAADGTAVTSRRINLAAPIPVIFLYASVWLDPSGEVVFGPDPLGRDLPLFRKLTATSSS